MLAHHMIQVEKLFKNTGKSVRTSLVTLSMSLIALDPIFSMSWECCAGLSVDLVIIIGKLFYYQRFLLSWKDTQMQIGTSYKMIPKWLVNIYLISLKELFLRKSKKQNILAQSTSEFEKMALATASEEASWLTCLLGDIPLWENNCQLCWSIAIIPRLLQKIENCYYNGKRWQICHRTELLEWIMNTLMKI